MPIQLVYTGPGANASSIRITPRTTTIDVGAPFALTATVSDANGTPIADAPTMWTSLDTAHALIAQPLEGVGRGTTAGTGRIVATLLTGQSDTVTLIVAAVPTNISLIAGSGQTGIVQKPNAAVLTQPLVVRVTSAGGIPMGGVAVTFAVGSGGGSVAPPTATTDTTGNAQAVWTLGNVVGAQTATAAVSGLAGSPVTFTATGIAPVPARLAFVVAPAANANFAPDAPIALSVAVEDGDGDRVTTFSGPVTLLLASNPSAAALAGTVTVNAVSGIATFTTLHIAALGTGYAISAGEGALPSITTPTFNIVSTTPSNPGAIALLTGGSQTGVFGSTLAQPISVKVVDSTGSPVAGMPVAFTVASGGGTLSAASAATDATGVASTRWTLGPSGTQTLTITAPGPTGSPISVGATGIQAAANQWVITQYPAASQTAGVAITPAVVAQLRDASNAVVSSYNGAATIGIGANPGSATLVGTTTAVASAGVVSFSGPTVNVAAAGYTLVVSSSNVPGAVTTAFTVNPGPPTTFVLQAGANQTGAFGATLSQPISARVTDAEGNGVPGVAVTFSVSAGGGTASPTSVVTSSTGVATATWTLGASGLQTMAITSSGLTGSPLTVSATGIAPSGNLPKLFIDLSAPTMGVGQDDDQDARIATAIATDLTVTVANSDGTKASMPATVVIPAGRTFVSFVARGLAAGTSRFVASVAGYAPDTVTLVVTTPVVHMSGGNPIFAFTPFALDVFPTDSLFIGHRSTAGITVTLRSSDATVLTVPPVAIIDPESRISERPLSVLGHTAGTAWVYATAAGPASDSALYTVMTPSLTFRKLNQVQSTDFTAQSVGAHQYRAPTEFWVQNAPASAIITQRHPEVLSLSLATFASSGFFGFAGLTPGVDTLIASAPGYIGDTAIVTVTTPQFAVSALATPLAVNAVEDLTLHPTDGTGPFGDLPSGPVTIHAVSSDPNVLQPNQAYYTLPRGTNTLTTAVRYIGGGTATITYSDSAGYYLPATTNAVTVNAPLPVVSVVRAPSAAQLGMRQRSSGFDFAVSLSTAASSALTVNLSTSDSRVATVPATTTFPAGLTSASVIVTAHDTTGTVSITASAAGYSPGSSASVEVTEPTLAFTTIITNTVSTAPASGFRIVTTDASGVTHAVAEDLTVMLASSAPALATVSASSFVIAAGQSTNSTQLTWKPQGAGMPQLIASDPRPAFYHYLPAAATLTIVQSATVIGPSPVAVGVGQFVDMNVAIPWPTGASNIPVQLSHTNGATSIPASTTLGIVQGTFRLTGLQVGTDTVTASVDGHSPATVIVTVNQPTANVFQWPAQLRGGRFGNGDSRDDRTERDPAERGQRDDVHTLPQWQHPIRLGWHEQPTCVIGHRPRRVEQCAGLGQRTRRRDRIGEH